MGVAGTGKTTVGKLLALELGATFCDADDLHPAANIEKMTRGEPLDDADRWPWLDRVRARIDDALHRREGLVVACSALKQSYRQRLCGDPRVLLVYLRGSKATILERLRARKNHFMPAALIDSQCETLEEPAAADALVVDISEAPPSLVARIRGRLREAQRSRVA